MSERVKDLVLHIDDNLANRYAVRRILERIGLDVIEGATGAEGLRLAEENPDLIILDIKLPDVNGFEVCRRLKADPRYRAIPVLQMSANFTQTHDKVEGLESGADGYLAQPIEPAVLVATVQSLLRIRRGERERARLIAHLQEERVVREKFVATLTHDLRNPLTAAQMCGELIRRTSGTDGTSELAERLIANIQRADSMIQDLLDASLLHAGHRLPLKMDRVDLGKFIDRVIEDLALQYANPLVVEIDSVRDLQGYWSPRGLRRVLENLIGNAVKYGAPQGPISLRIVRENDKILASVHNFGNSISEEDQKTLFEDFHRTHSAQTSGKQGWGLGLGLVKGMAEAHGGQVKLQSDATRGTTFTIALPIDSRPFEASHREANA